LCLHTADTTRLVRLALHEGGRDVMPSRVQPLNASPSREIDAAMEPLMSDMADLMLDT
jgi:hypothetical protein